LHSAIAGGRTHQITSNFSSIGGGRGNNVFSAYGAVSGGINNIIQVASDASVILGGESNSIQGTHSTITGGSSNSINTLSHATIASGGLSDVTGDYSTNMSHDSSISGDYSTAIAGERHNLSGNFMTALGDSQTSGTGNYAVNAQGWSILNGNYSIDLGWHNENNAENTLILGHGQTINAASTQAFIFAEDTLDFNIMSPPQGSFVFYTGDSPASARMGFKIQPAHPLHFANGARIEIDGDVCTAANVCLDDVASDGRLKRNTSALSGALEKILRLKPVTFEWNSKSPYSDFIQPQMGFLAQDIKKIFPQWVSEDKKGNKLLDLRGLDTVLIEGLKEIHAKTSNLAHQHQRINDLKTQLKNALQSQHDTITQQNKLIEQQENELNRLRSQLKGQL
jgi:hypothetical protein